MFVKTLYGCIWMYVCAHVYVYVFVLCVCIVSVSMYAFVFSACIVCMCCVCCCRGDEEILKYTFPSKPLHTYTYPACSFHPYIHISIEGLVCPFIHSYIYIHPNSFSSDESWMWMNRVNAYVCICSFLHPSICPYVNVHMYACVPWIGGHTNEDHTACTWHTGHASFPLRCVCGRVSRWMLGVAFNLTIHMLCSLTSVHMYVSVLLVHIYVHLPVQTRTKPASSIHTFMHATYIRTSYIHT